MANKLFNTTDITNIANSIRTKLGVATTYKVSEMSGAIDSIPSGSTLYKHTMVVTDQEFTGTWYINLINDVSTPYTTATILDLATWLYNKGCTSATNAIFAAYTGGGLAGYTFNSVFSNDGTTILIGNDSFNYSVGTITSDTVTTF